MTNKAFPLTLRTMLSQTMLHWFALPLSQFNRVESCSTSSGLEWVKVPGPPSNGFQWHPANCSQPETIPPFLPSNRCTARVSACVQEIREKDIFKSLCVQLSVLLQHLTKSLWFDFLFCIPCLPYFTYFCLFSALRVWSYCCWKTNWFFFTPFLILKKTKSQGTFIVKSLKKSNNL